MPQPAEGPRDKLGLRVLSSVVLIGFVVAAIAGGSPYFTLLIALAVATLAWEWTRLCSGPAFGAVGGTLTATGLLVVAAAATGRYGLAGLALPVGAAAVILAGRIERRAHVGWLAAGVFYIGVPAMALLWIIAEPTLGRQTVGWAVAVVVATDIGAYVVGRAVGGPRLAPRISPNKTWSGLLGGMACAALIGIMAGLLLDLPRYGPLAAASAVLAVVAQLGDLLESRVKRQFGVKDAGGIIPGHGGLLDRVDGHLFAAIAVAGFNWISGESILTWH